jgi:hypothetical protein
MKDKVEWMKNDVKCEVGDILNLQGMDELKNGTYMVVREHNQLRNTYKVRYVGWLERIWMWVCETGSVKLIIKWIK